MINQEIKKERFAIRRSIEIGHGNTIFRIRQISDTHQDGEGFREDLFKKFVAIQSKDKNSVWIHTGDVTDSQRPSTRQMKQVMYVDRKEAWTQEDKHTFDWIDRRIIPQYEKIKDSCLGIIDGDHYHLFANGMTSGRYISYKLGIPFLGERSAFVSLVFSPKGSKTSLQYIIHARHGKGGTASIGGSANALVKGDACYMADLHLGGHNHQAHCHPQRLEYLSTHAAIKSRIQWYVRGGSFLDGFHCSNHKTYAYRKEYQPLPCGWAEVELNLGRNYVGVGKARMLEIQMSKASIVAG